MYLFLIYFINYAITVVLFPPLCSPLPCTTIPPLYFMSMGPTYKFFGFYTPILFLTSPSIFVPTIYASYSLYLFPHSPLPPPLITLHVISISVILSCSSCLLSLILFLF